MYVYDRKKIVSEQVSIDLIHSYTTRWQIVLVEEKGGLTVGRQMVGMFSRF
jgi:hypothetical protein